MRISNIFQVVWLSHSTRIMGRPVLSGVAIEIVVRAIQNARAFKHWSIATNSHNFWRRRLLFTGGGHAFDDTTAYTSRLPINQTSISRMTNQPIVDIALDKDLSAKLFPQGEFYGIVVCFVQRRGCWDTDIHLLFCSPIWSWGDCIWCMTEILVISESITPY